MTSDDHEAIDRLDAYLDAIAAGRSIPTHELDPKLYSIDQRFRALDRAPDPPPAFAARLLEDLIQGTTSANLDPFNQSTGPALLPDGRFVPEPLSPPLRRPKLSRPRWALAQLATAALLLVTLIGSLVVFGPLRPGRNQEPRTVMQAHDMAPPDNSADTLLAVTTLSRDAIPDPFWADLWRVWIASGGGFAVEAGHPWTDEPGTGVDSVLAGQVAVRSEGPIRVLRAWDTEEVITADTEVVLGPGDAWVYPWEQPRVYENVGDGSVELLMASVYTPGQYGPEPPAGYMARTGNWVNDTPASTLPPGPVELTLRRLVVGPGTPIPRGITEGTEGLRLTIGEPMPPLEARSPLGAPLTGGERTLYVLTLGIPTAPGSGPP